MEHVLSSCHGHGQTTTSLPSLYTCRFAKLSTHYKRYTLLQLYSFPNTLVCAFVVSVNIKHDLFYILCDPSRTHVCIMYTPLNTTFIGKTGVCRGIPIFLIFAQNIDCGYTLEPPHRDENFQILKLKNICLLHGQVFLMDLWLALT